MTSRQERKRTACKVQLLIIFAAIAVAATGAYAEQASAYLTRQAIPASPATAPDLLQLPAAWVQALNDAIARTEQINKEVGGCLTFAVDPAADSARREAATRLLSTPSMDNKATVDELQRRALAAREATGPVARGIALGDGVSVTATCSFGETRFHTHPAFVPGTNIPVPFLPSGPDAANSLLAVTKESTLMQNLAVIRGKAGISLVLPTQLATDITGLAEAFKIGRFDSILGKDQEIRLRQLKTNNGLRQMISSLAFPCPEPDQDFACYSNQMAAMLEAAGFAFYTGENDGMLRRVRPAKPAKLEINSKPSLSTRFAVATNMTRHLATGWVPASAQAFLQPPPWRDMVTAEMRAAHTQFALLFARAGFTFSDEILVFAQYFHDMHFPHNMPGVTVGDMTDAKLDGKGKRLPIGFTVCNLYKGKEIWTITALAERWLPAGATSQAQLLLQEGGRAGAVIYSEKESRVLAAAYGHVVNGKVVFEGESPTQYGVTWQGKFTIEGDNACTFQPFGAGVGSFADPSTGGVFRLEGSVKDKHFTGSSTDSKGRSKQINNLKLF